MKKHSYQKSALVSKGIYTRSSYNEVLASCPSPDPECNPGQVAQRTVTLLVMLSSYSNGCSMRSRLGPLPSPTLPMPGLMGLVWTPPRWHHQPPPRLLAPGPRSLWARWLTGSGRPWRGSPRRCASPQKAPSVTFHTRAHRTAPHPWAPAQRCLPSLHRRTGALTVAAAAATAATAAAAAGARTMMCACATARRTWRPPRSWSPTWRAVPPACAASCSFATPPQVAPSCPSCATR